MVHMLKYAPMVPPLRYPWPPPAEGPPHTGVPCATRLHWVQRTARAGAAQVVTRTYVVDEKADGSARRGGSPCAPTGAAYPAAGTEGKRGPGAPQARQRSLL